MVYTNNFNSYLRTVHYLHFGTHRNIGTLEHTGILGLPQKYQPIAHMVQVIKVKHTEYWDFYHTTLLGLLQKYQFIIQLKYFRFKLAK